MFLPLADTEPLSDPDLAPGRCRLDHLLRLTDPQGVMCSARGEVPDRFAGYRAIDNAEALRLCCRAERLVEREPRIRLARTCFGFLSRGRGFDSGVHPRRDSVGGWVDDGDDELIQSVLARALSATIASELPEAMRHGAGQWFELLAEDHAFGSVGPHAMANWLIALGQLRPADPGRDDDLAAAIAERLCVMYYAAREPGWEWYQPHWSVGAAALPTALWHAHRELGYRSLYRVAEATTTFLIEQLFDGNRLAQPGSFNRGLRGTPTRNWSGSPAEVASIVDLLCTAEQVSGRQEYGERAFQAAVWFTGHNAEEICMVERHGACHDALMPHGPADNCCAAATLAWLHAQAAMSHRPPHPEPAPLFISPLALTEDGFVDLAAAG